MKNLDYQYFSTEDQNSRVRYYTRPAENIVVFQVETYVQKSRNFSSVIYVKIQVNFKCRFGTVHVKNHVKKCLIS